VVRALAIDAAITAGRGPSTTAQTEGNLVRAATIATRLGDPQFAAMVLVSRGFSEFLQGRFQVALASTVTGVGVLRESARHAFFELRTGEMVHLWLLSCLGQLFELARRREPFLAAADARADLYAATTMRLGPPSIAALRGDDPIAARAAMRAASAKWSQPGYHTPHYWAMYAEAQVDLYEGHGHAAWTRVQDSWAKLRNALMFYAQVIFLEASFLRARAALATVVEQPALESAMLRSAARDAKTLAGADAREHLLKAITGLEAVGMRLHAEAARWRLGQLLGGGEGAALAHAAEEWARGEGVVSPPRMFAMIAPGFAASSSARPRLAAPR